MSKLVFNDVREIAESEGFELDREQGAYSYCVWFNSPSGSKEIFSKTLKDVLEGIEELKTIRDEEGVK